MDGGATNVPIFGSMSNLSIYPTTFPSIGLKVEGISYNFLYSFFTETNCTKKVHEISEAWPNQIAHQVQGSKLQKISAYP